MGLQRVRHDWATKLNWTKMMIMSLRAFVATQIVSMSGFHNKAQRTHTHTHTHAQTHMNTHKCTGENKRYWLCMIATSFSKGHKDIGILAKYRAPNLRLVEPKGKVLPGTVGKEVILIPRSFREFCLHMKYWKLTVFQVNKTICVRLDSKSYFSKIKTNHKLLSLLSSSIFE